MISLQNTYTSATKSFVNANRQGNVDIESIIRPEDVYIEHEHAVVRAGLVLKSSPAIANLDFRFSSRTSAAVVIHFGLSQAYASHFTLLKGLFEFGNVGLLTVEANRESKTFDLVLKTSDATRLEDILQGIVDSLEREIRFKTKLKEIIAWENSRKVDQAKAYEGFSSIFSK